MRTDRAVWIGRGKFTREEWESALVEARAHLKQPTADYLLRNPKLAPHLESGLAEFNLTIDGFELAAPPLGRRNAADVDARAKARPRRRHLPPARAGFRWRLGENPV